jgi:hypothetical protein
MLLCSGSVKPSYVLKAMGIADDVALSTLRLTVGRFTTLEEVSNSCLYKGIEPLGFGCCDNSVNVKDNHSAAASAERRRREPARAISPE